MKKLIAGGAVLIALLGGSGLVATPTAEAATKSCRGSSCEGKDPHTYGCDKDAKNMAQFKLNHHMTYLRYSKKCKAWWALATNSTTGPADPVYVRSYKWEGVPPDHRVLRKSYQTNVQYDRNSWTRMTTGSWDFKACETDLVPTFKGQKAGWYCTGYRN